ncbi:MAG: vitamin K epoxide reductase family protein [Anaerolineaceae bacterium]|nr:MAG: vitamin K epoxide reductase family protein [Anaerolineaceae bacterium]
MKRFLVCSLLVFTIAFGVLVPPAVAQDSVVRAILFYLPTCPHCHIVMTEHFPLFLEMFNTQIEWIYLPTEEALEPDQVPPVIMAMGDRLQILYVDASSPAGGELYWVTIEHFEAHDQTGVPYLIVGETMLYGSVDIPEQFPGIIEQGLAQGGIDWPDIPGLADLLSQMVPYPPAEPTEEEVATPTELPEEPTPGETMAATKPPLAPTPTTIFNFEGQQTTVIDRIKNDLVGNILAIVVLIGLIVVFIITLIRVYRQPTAQTSPKPSVLIPFLAMVGIFVAGYLTFVETSGGEAVCGPVGDCNTVQQSKYATLFGVLPVGLLGLIGNLLIFGSWIITRLDLDRLSDLATVAIFGMAAFGTLFSIYLTFLEPFVIGATCAWCLTSAVVTAAIFWFSADPMSEALDRL